MNDDDIISYCQQRSLKLERAFEDMMKECNELQEYFFLTEVVGCYG